MEKKRKIPDFVLSTGSIVSTMRLIIEGAITILMMKPVPCFTWAWLMSEKRRPMPLIRLGRAFLNRELRF